MAGVMNLRYRQLKAGTRPVDLLIEAAAVNDASPPPPELPEGTAITTAEGTAIAAAIAGGMRLPFTGALLGVLLTISAGPAITVPAILGAVVGMLTRLAADQGFAQPEPAVAG